MGRQSLGLGHRIQEGTMTAAERAIKRMEEKLRDMSERHREAMLRERLQVATHIGIEVAGLYGAMLILREEMQKEGKQ